MITNYKQNHVYIEIDVKTLNFSPLEELLQCFGLANLPSWLPGEARPSTAIKPGESTTITGADPLSEAITIK